MAAYRDLRMPILLFGVAALLLVCIATLVYQARLEQITDIAHRQQQLVDLQQQQQRLVQEQTLLARYQPMNKMLQQSGIFSAPQPAQWLNALQAIYHNQQLLRLDYHIKPQPSIQLSNSYDWTVHQSDMAISMDLLHEGDLLSVLDGLQQTASPFIIKACQLMLIQDADFNRQRLGANLSAQCQLQWINLSQTQGQPS